MVWLCIKAAFSTKDYLFFKQRSVPITIIFGHPSSASFTTKNTIASIAWSSLRLRTMFENLDIAIQTYNNVCYSKEFRDIQYDFSADGISRTILTMGVDEFDSVFNYVPSFFVDQRAQPG